MNISYERTKRHGYIVLPASSSASIIPDALHIELDDENKPCTNHSTTIPLYKDLHEAAMQAEKDGIPIVHDIPGAEDWVYVDTPENRAIIHRALRRYPRFDCRTWSNPESASVIWTTDNLRATDLVVSMDGKSVEATFECWHEIFKKLGVNQEQVEEDANDDVWINLYANYYPADGALTMCFTVADNTFNDMLLYEPSEADCKVVIATMEAACKRECNCTMAELIAQHSEEATERVTEVPTETCKVVFCRTGGTADGYEFSIFLNVNQQAHSKEDADSFSLSVDERQEAYAIASKKIGWKALKDFVIQRAFPLRDYLILLVEVRDEEPWVISAYSNYTEAQSKMRERVFCVCHEEYADDTCVLTDRAWTKNAEETPWDWAIFAVPPVTGAENGCRDSRSMLYTVQDREISEPEIFVSQEAAREKMFADISSVILESVSSVREQYESCNWPDGTNVTTQGAVIRRNYCTYAWDIAPLEDFH